MGWIWKEYKWQGAAKDHVYRMVIVEGCCTMARLSSFRSKLFIGWHKRIVSSDWSDTMVWFGPILLYLSFTILYIWSLHVLNDVLLKVTKERLKNMTQKLVQQKRREQRWSNLRRSNYKSSYNIIPIYLNHHQYVLS